MPRVIPVGAHPVRDVFHSVTKGNAHRVRSYR
jgi:hypothetical protein